MLTYHLNLLSNPVNPILYVAEKQAIKVDMPILDYKFRKSR